MMRHRTWRLQAAVALLLLPLAGPLSEAFAASLDEFRAQGVIGERFDGFAEARPGASSEARKLVTEVNGKRKRVYDQRAKQQGVAADQVGRIYANEIIDKLPSGSWIRLENGNWRQK